MECTRYASAVSAWALALLDVGGSRYALVDARWPESADEATLSLHGPTLLRPLVAAASSRLQRFLVEQGDVSPPSGDALVERVAELVARGQLRVVKLRVVRPAIDLDHVVDLVDISDLGEPIDDLASESSTDEAITWVAFRIVDDAGTPVAGRGFSLVLPDGSTVEGVTDGDGRFLVESVAAAGTCELRLRAAS